ncbi:hypothetical protein [Streptomyces sp. 184]|uniref:hypothetical protein n=1 Tax=Streptomyces sp. 184 TaxID=1827526 RepID=UPI003892BA6E
MGDLAWVPRSCTLPTAERPLRVAEWDALFADGPVTLSRPEPLRLRLLLGPAEGPGPGPGAGPGPGSGPAERVRELAERESACCSFFTFTTGVTTGRDGAGDGDGGRTADDLWLEITVDQPHEAVLDALAARIAAAAER